MNNEIKNERKFKFLKVDKNVDPLLEYQRIMMTIEELRCLFREGESNKNVSRNQIIGFAALEEIATVAAPIILRPDADGMVVVIDYDRVPSTYNILTSDGLQAYIDKKYFSQLSEKEYYKIVYEEKAIEYEAKCRQNFELVKIEQNQLEESYRKSFLDIQKLAFELKMDKDDDTIAEAKTMLYHPNRLKSTNKVYTKKIGIR